MFLVWYQYCCHTNTINATAEARVCVESICDMWAILLGVHYHGTLVTPIEFKGEAECKSKKAKRDKVELYIRTTFIFPFSFFRVYFQV